VGPNGLKPVPISQADVMVTWHSLATMANRYLTNWNLRIPKRHSDGYLHVWQVTAAMLGVKDEYIPATWAAADSQAQQVLDPILAATPEGIELADTLLDLAQLDLNNDGVGPLRVPLNALTRYMLGDEITDSLEIPRNTFWDELVAWAWPRFVAIREGAILLPLPPNVLWFFDEILRNGVLFYLGEGQNIFIEMPTANRESFPS
jgi:hypothetical protein